MKHKWRLALVPAIAFMMILGTSVYAFDDLPQGTDGNKIMELKQKGIVSGNGKSFMGRRNLSHAEGIQLLVKGIDLNLNAFLFIKEPQASDSFDNVPNHAWYAKSFVIASLNGLDLPRDLDPKAVMTREEYAHHLLSAMLIKGDYPFTKRLFPIADETDIKPNYRQSIQLLLNAHIVELDKNDNFAPKKAITRQEAAVMLYNTIQYMKAHQTPGSDDGAAVDETVTFTLEKAIDNIQKVTLTWGEKPNTGYQIKITSIEFRADQTAVVSYQLQYPEKGRLYADVITTPQAVTYLSADYTPIIQRDPR